MAGEREWSQELMHMERAISNASKPTTYRTIDTLDLVKPRKIQAYYEQPAISIFIIYTYLLKLDYDNIIVMVDSNFFVHSFLILICTMIRAHAYFSFIIHSFQKINTQLILLQCNTSHSLYLEE